MKITIIGDFAYGKPIYSGQTAKCRDIYNVIKKQYTNVKTIDTRSWKRHLFSRTLRLLVSLFSTDVYILPLCRNGRRVVLTKILKLKKFFGYKIIFPAVGGSLLYDYQNEKKLMQMFSKIDGVFFETNQMVDAFKKMGFENIYYLPVFSTRVLTVMKTFRTEPIFNFCTYSRVIREKGITLAINAISKVNERYGKIICSLDVYGSPSPEYADEFNELVEKHRDFIFSKPLLGDEAIDELAKHYALLFPTYYEGEGFPIALIECMKAGLPCICSDWHFNSEIIKDGFDGFIFDLKDTNALESCIINAIENPKIMMKMSENCIEESKKYLVDNLFKEMFELIDEVKK